MGGLDVLYQRPRRLWIPLLLAIALTTPIAPVMADSGGGGGGGGGPAPAADLVVRNLTSDDTDPVEGETIRFTYVLANQGGSSSGNFTLSRSIQGDQGGGGGGFIHPSMDPGEVETRSFNWTAQSGNWTVTVTADGDDRVNESDETNNVDRLELHVEDASTSEQPNLAVVDILEEPDLEEGDVVRFAAEIANLGDAPAPASEAAFLLDGEERLGAPSVPALDPGEHTFVHSDTWQATAGHHTIEVIVDPADAVAESDEGDNRLGEDISVSRAKPDLIADVDVSPVQVTTEEDPRVLYDVSNRGNGDAGAFTIVLLLDGEILRKDRLDGLASGLGFGASFPLEEPLTPGEHRLSFVVDAGGEIAEIAERNNRDTATFEVVVPPDPAVVDLQVEKTRIQTDAGEGPVQPWAGQQVTVGVLDLSRGEVPAIVDVVLRACPADTAGPLPDLAGGCEIVRSWIVKPEDLEDGARLQTTWDTWGKAGDWTLCAHLEVPFAQLEHDNDARCTETFVVAGGTGLGGVDAAEAGL